MTSVRDILTHPVYTGAIVWNRSTGGKIHAVGENGKAEARPNAKRIHRKPKKQWVVIDDVHEPLVSKADFDKVQEIVSKRRKAGGAAKTKSPVPPLQPDALRAMRIHIPRTPAGEQAETLPLLR